MSFSSNIKEELSKISNLANKECVKAEFVGYLISSNISVIKNKIRYSTENQYNINRFNKILTNLNIDYNIELQGKVYAITFKKQEFVLLKNIEGDIQIKKEDVDAFVGNKKELMYKAIVRGAFLGSGSLNNPHNKYHLEILFSTKDNAVFILEILKQFNIQAKLLERKKNYSVYIKEAEEISKCLALMGANKAVLEFEEIRVVRETRNNINRLVNCETANLNKTINAAVEQINAIQYIKKKGKFDELSDNLKEIANIRIKNPDANLVELGQMLDSPIGKSGVNHRLKKICEIAELLKNNER